MGKDQRRICQQAAPVARVMRTLAQIDGQVETDAPARSHEHGRRIRLQARSVRGDQHVGRQPVLVRSEKLGQPGRTGFFAHLDQDLAVEPQRATRFQHCFQRCDVDQMLSLVVRRTAPIEPVAFLNQPERVQPVAPLFGLGTNHIAVAISKHGRQVRAFDAFGQQQRATARVGVVEDLATVARGLKARQHRLGQIAVQFRATVGFLALCFKGHQVRKFGLEPATVEIVRDAGDSGVAAHIWSSAMASPQGDMISVQPVFLSFRRITPAGQAKA